MKYCKLFVSAALLLSLSAMAMESNGEEGLEIDLGASTIGTNYVYKSSVNATLSSSTTTTSSETQSLEEAEEITDDLTQSAINSSVRRNHEETPVVEFRNSVQGAETVCSGGIILKNIWYKISDQVVINTLKNYDIKTIDDILFQLALPYVEYRGANKSEVEFWYNFGNSTGKPYSFSQFALYMNNLSNNDNQRYTKFIKENLKLILEEFADRSSRAEKGTKDAGTFPYREQWKTFVDEVIKVKLADIVENLKNQIMD